MKSIVIFSGTTEGRTLAESFAAAGIPVTVCVATEYGEEVMTPDPLISVHTGRMGAEEIAVFLKDRQTDIVFDATHPYAEIVSRNIKEATENLGIEYRRVERQTGNRPDSKYLITHVKDADEAVKILEQSDDKILLTTGSKALKEFLSVRERLYVRVLPSVKSIELCEKYGISNSHIIAEQGPFTYEENLALIKRYGIGVMVTKNSGKNGGYDEKIRAAKDAKIQVITIDPPVETETAPYSKTDFKSISVIGAGCGEATLTAEAAGAIKEAEVIIGSDRLLDYRIVKNNPCQKYKAYMPKDIFNAIINAKKNRVAILFSGDKGFKSGAKAFIKYLGIDRDFKFDKDGVKGQIRVIPGISSVVMFAARCGISLDDSAVLSLHGISVSENLDKIRDSIYHNKYSIFLLSSKSDIYDIASFINKDKDQIKVTVGTDLGMSDEAIVSFLPSDMRRVDDLDGRLYIMMISRGTDNI